MEFLIFFYNSISVWIPGFCDQLIFAVEVIHQRHQDGRAQSPFMSIFNLFFYISEAFISLRRKCLLNLIN